MMRLLLVEMTRLRWRRAVLLLVAAAVVVPAVIWGATAWNTRPVSEAEQARAERLVERDIERPAMQRQLRQCVEHPDRYGVPEGGDVQATCEDMMLPQVGWYLFRTPLDLDESRTGDGIAVVTVLAMLLLLIGTTFAGNDWNTGSMSNQLLFDPRRGRVWAAKGIVVLVSGTVLAGVVLLGYWTGLWLLAEQRGLDPSGTAVADGYWQVLRGSVFAGCCALGGYALTMLFRSTVATLGVLFAVTLIRPLLLAVIGFPGYERWQPHTNVLAFVQDGTTYYVEDAMATRLLSLEAGATYLGVVLLVALVPSVLTFRNRDVP